jgi:hypothetical protein
MSIQIEQGLPGITKLGASTFSPLLELECWQPVYCAEFCMPPYQNGRSRREIDSHAPLRPASLMDCAFIKFNFLLQQLRQSWTGWVARYDTQCSIL